MSPDREEDDTAEDARRAYEEAKARAARGEPPLQWPPPWVPDDEKH